LKLKGEAIMENSRSSFSLVLLLIALALTACAIIVVVSAPAFGQETDPYKATATQAPSLADAPLEFQVISLQQNGPGVTQITVAPIGAGGVT
jgi:hypothetical protein